MQKRMLPLFALINLLFSTAVLADHTITYKAKLIPFDSKTLEEPPTEIEFELKLQTKSKIDNPFTEQLLRDSVTPYINSIKEEIEGIMTATDELLQSGEIDEETGEELVKQLNRNFKNITKDASKQGEKLLKKQWETLVKEDKSLRDWKIKANVEITKGTFSLAKGVISAVGSGGLSLVVEIVGIVNSLVTIGDNLSKLLSSEASARKDLLEAIADVDKKLKGEKRSIIKNLKDVFLGSENTLEEELETYDKKLIGVRQEAEKLAKALNKLLNKQDELQELAKEEGGDLADGLEDMEKMTKQYLAGIDGVNDSRKVGAKLQKQGEKMLELAREKEGKLSKLRDKLVSVIELGDQIVTLMDPIDTLIEHGSNAGGAAAKSFGDYIASKK